ncbi:MAG: hypothetical protein JW384_03465 [Nitrosomonadaceae bacterium]|nr:hypothetical protein [Nitrosomonadaceae bacterium]
MGLALALRSPVTLPLLFVVWIAIAEFLTAAVDPRVGVMAHAVLLVMLLFQGSMVDDSKQQALLWCLTLGPLIRLLSLCLPLVQFPVLYWYAIISFPVFAATVTVARLLGYSWQDLGLIPNRQQLPGDLLMLPMGVALGFVEYIILRPLPLSPSLSLEHIWLPALILTVATGFEEELIFRGLLQKAATSALGSTFGLLFVSTLFACLHIGYLSIIDIVFVFAVGHIFALRARSSGSILGPTLAHGGVNSCLFLIAPFLISPL